MGQLIPVNNNQFRVHLACFGDVYDKKSDQPIVLVEGGQMTSSEVFQEWIEELHHLDKVERYCIGIDLGMRFPILHHPHKVLA